MKSKIELLKEEIDQRKKMLRSLNQHVKHHEEKIRQLENKVSEYENDFETSCSFGKHKSQI